MNTGINHSISDDNINVYPNPVTDKLFIETTREINSVEIIDIHGKRIFNIENHSISATDLNNGIYILKFIMKDGDIETRKVIIQD